jgi:hypothetical protein
MWIGRGDHFHLLVDIIMPYNADEIDEKLTIRYFKTEFSKCVPSALLWDESITPEHEQPT